ncbi:MAG: hypothetical protein IPP63_16170 [Chloracidobacterium sp.]|nr:hypothetical protein [Chloracidobacterium sp.]
MKAILLMIFMLAVLANVVSAQIKYDEEQFRAFDAKGNPVTIDQSWPRPV